MPWVMKTIVLPERLPDPQQLALQIFARLGVERGERLVHQENVGIVGEAAGDRHALLHAAGKLVGITVAESGEADHGEKVLGLLGALAAGDALGLQPEFDALERCPPGKERVLLKRQAAVERRPDNWVAVDQNAA